MRRAWAAASLIASMSVALVAGCTGDTATGPLGISGEAATEDDEPQASDGGSPDSRAADATREVGDGRAEGSARQDGTLVDGAAEVGGDAAPKEAGGDVGAKDGAAEATDARQVDDGGTDSPATG
jgi:hypothetical protein